MAGKNQLPKKVKGTAVPKFDQGVTDFFRGSRGINYIKGSNNFRSVKRDFTGFRRGSK